MCTSSPEAMDSVASDGHHSTAAAHHAVTAVYMFYCIPFGLASLMMLRFVRVTLGRPDRISSRGGLERHLL
jgi:hypothetical protein